MISFGAGDGARDRLLMGTLKDVGCECLYFPVDASQTMLEMACAGADDGDIETVGIKDDISSPVHVIYAADAAEPSRLEHVGLEIETEFTSPDARFRTAICRK